MSTSDKTLNQVRAILNKLDRSIDEARERRLQPPAPPTPPPAPAPQAARPVSTGNSAPSAPSQYGRAQPLQRPQANNMLRWNP
jgi:hypothetical protein